MVSNSALELLHNNTHILCVSHVGPDGDAVGSLLAMAWILRLMGKNPVAALQDTTPDELLWLPGVEQIVRADAARRHFDLIVCLDASSSDRMGHVYVPAFHDSIPMLVIDHHVTNTNFGTVNWVDAQSASTCQMLVELLDALQIEPTYEIATCLLTGIVTDTLCFRTSNTTEAVLNCAVKLMQAGAKLTEITQRTLDLRPYRALRLAGMAMAETQLEQGVLWASMTKAQAAATGAEANQTNLSSILSRTIEADISAVFTEKSDGEGKPLVDCSFRAKPGFDVSAVALALGGGGHRAAAGCTLPGLLTDVVPKVVGQLQQARNQSAKGQINQ